MCGFFLYFDPSGSSPDPTLLEQSKTMLRHRGPDACGTWCDRGIGMAHTRLSLLDPNPRSNQPFWDESQRYALLYNGETYNFRELRRELQAQGVSFRTESDTEVVLHSLLQWGPREALPRLNGMFALALVDRQRRRVLLARDRFGIKPLWILRARNRVLAASEAKALSPWHMPEPNTTRIIAYLLGGGLPTEGETFFQGVEIFPAGSFLEFEEAEFLERREFARYFDLSEFWEPDRALVLASESLASQIDRTEERLREAVRRQLFADAPVGAFCSGGVDSSVIVAMAASERRDIQLFHADVVGKYSEFDTAKRLANHLRLDLHRVEVTDQDFVDLLPIAMYHFEHPFSYHPNSVPFMKVAHEVHEQGVKGMLSGEGADEAFLGYPRIALERATAPYRAARRALSAVARRIPGLQPLSKASVAGPLLGELMAGFKKTLERKRLEHHSHGTMITLQHLGDHLRTLLYRNDAMGMAASVEARFPYLDHHVIELAVNLPIRSKIRLEPFQLSFPFTGKWVLRKVASRYLPAEFSLRKKRGFPTDALDRLEIHPDFFKNGFVADLLSIRAERFHLLDGTGDSWLKRELALLEVWGRTCITREPTEHVRDDLMRFGSFS